MRRSSILVAAIAVTLSASAATAASKKDTADCERGTDADRRISACTRALDSGNQTKRQRLLAFNARCIALLEKLEPDRAITDCTEAIRLNPKDAGPYHNRGQALWMKGENDRAIADLDESISIEPVASGYAMRGKIWQEKHELDRALADISRAIRLEPKNPAPYHMRASVLREKGDYDAALADDNQSIRLDPKSSGAYVMRGATWRLKGDLERAMADQDKAIQMNPKEVAAYVRRGDTLRYSGKFDRALADYDHALSMEPGYIAAFAGRGLTYEKMGDLTRARIEFERATKSQHPVRSGIASVALETVQARLAALNSGAPQPVIPAAPSRASSPTSIPTPAPAVPKAVPAKPPGRRVGLVIGNSSYKNVPALINPQRDAQAVAATLRAVGFDKVTLADDSTREKLVNALRTFANEAEKADWAVIYYAGHGIEVNGVNYMIPIDAKLAADRDVQFEAVPLDQVMASVEGAKKLKLVLLDACRDNPFAPQMRKTTAPAAVAANSTAGGTVGTRSVGRGLGEVKVSGATLVVYAAKHGQTALDGEGGNSPFAVAVVQRLATPNVEINKLFRLVRDDVMEATAGRQEPYTYGSLPGREDFFFVQR